jgi:hypothetical protein
MESSKNFVADVIVIGAGLARIMEDRAAVGRVKVLLLVRKAISAQLGTCLVLRVIFYAGLSRRESSGSFKRRDFPGRTGTERLRKFLCTLRCRRRPAVGDVHRCGRLKARSPAVTAGMIRPAKF